MTAGLRPYPEMTDSGVETLGQVPAHWEVRKLGQIGRFWKGNGGNKEDEEPTGVPCIRYGDLYTKHTYFIHESRGYISPGKAKDYTPIAFGDVLFAGSGETIDEIGKSAVNLIHDEAYCGGDIILFRPNIKLNPKFMGYATNSRTATTQKAQMGRGFTVVHIYADQLKRLVMTLPPIDEQTAMVRFLDHADRRIQRYIRAKEKLIAVLEEQKQAIIHDAVTGQVDIRTGKPHRAYKEGGIPWLQKVPEHWEVRAAKWYFREVDDRSETGAEELLSVSHITGVTPRSEKNVTMFMAETNVGHKRCEPGDLVVNTMWAWMGALGIANQTGIVSPSYAVYRQHRSSRLLDAYVDLLLRTIAYKNEYICRSTGIRASRLRLYPDQFLGIKLLCPPVEEQRDIIEFVNRKSETVRRCMEITHNQLGQVEEYRARLVAVVTTGKVDVREAAATLYRFETAESEDDTDGGLPSTDATALSKPKAGVVESET